MGNLAELDHLNLDSNSLSGAIPLSFTNLALDLFWFDNTSLCEPQDPAFQAWLNGIPDLRRTGVLCVPTSIETGNDLPRVFTLEPNYPNPFKPATRIGYQVGRRGQVELAIYDVLGRRVRTLVGGEQEAGRHEVEWDGRDGSGQPVASGVYFYALKAAGFQAIRKMLLLR